MPGPPQSLRVAVRRAVSASSDCVPDGAVLLTTLYPEYARPMWHPVLQTHLSSVHALRFERILHERCLMRRVVTVCFDTSTDGVGECATVRPYLRPFQAWVIWGAGFHMWPMIAEALQSASAVLWVDPASLLLRNPFVDLMSAWPPGGAHLSAHVYICTRAHHAHMRTYTCQVAPTFSTCPRLRAACAHVHMYTCTCQVAPTFSTCPRLHAGLVAVPPCLTAALSRASVRAIGCTRR